MTKKKKQEQSPKSDDKIVAILKALPIRMDYRQIFHLQEEMCQHVATPLPYSFAGEFKDVRESPKPYTVCRLQHNYHFN